MANNPQLLGYSSLLGDTAPPVHSKWDRIKQALWESNLNSPVRGFYNLMNTPYDVLMGGDSPEKQQAVADSFDAAGGITVGSMPMPKPANSLTMGIKKIKNLKGQAVEPPREFYRGTNPESTERISTGMPDWDSYLFAADNEPSAQLYGRSIEKIAANPDARILYEGTGDWVKVVGKWRKDENMLQYADRAAKAAKAAGYDAAWFKRQSDIGTAIINPQKFKRGGGGW